MLASSHHQLVSSLIETELTIGDQIQFNVTSNSMQPVINIGDSIVMEVIPGKDVKIGDIIVIKRVDDFLSHRVISITKDGWVTKGDNNILLDPPVQSKNLIGRVRMVKQANQMINLETRKWHYINFLFAKIGELETRAFSRHRYFRLPFRILSKGIQKIIVTT